MLAERALLRALLVLLAVSVDTDSTRSAGPPRRRAPAQLGRLLGQPLSSDKIRVTASETLRSCASLLRRQQQRTCSGLRSLPHAPSARQRPTLVFIGNGARGPRSHLIGRRGAASRHSV